MLEINRMIKAEELERLVLGKCTTVIGIEKTYVINKVDDGYLFSIKIDDDEMSNLSREQFENDCIYSFKEALRDVAENSFNVSFDVDDLIAQILLEEDFGEVDFAPFDTVEEFMDDYDFDELIEEFLTTNYYHFEDLDYYGQLEVVQRCDCYSGNLYDIACNCNEDTNTWYFEDGSFAAERK